MYSHLSPENLHPHIPFSVSSRAYTQVDEACGLGLLSTRTIRIPSPADRVNHPNVATRPSARQHIHLQRVGPKLPYSDYTARPDARHSSPGSLHSYSCRCL